MNVKGLITIVVVFILGMLVLDTYPQYYLSYFILSSLVISFLVNYWMIPRPLRSMALRSPRFHRQVMINFAIYMVLGVILYVI